jgi:hypothetical protein
VLPGVTYPKVQPGPICGFYRIMLLLGAIKAIKKYNFKNQKMGENIK